MYNNGLEVVPPGINKLENLVVLALSGNNISTLPNDMSGLKKLELLGLYSNKFKVLPKSVTSIANLQALIVGSNYELSSVPRNIGDLTELRALSLNGSVIEFIPESVGNLKKLEYLGIFKSKITHLPKALAQIPRLSGKFKPDLIPQSTMEKYYGFEWNGIANGIDAFGIDTLKVLDPVFCKVHINVNGKYLSKEKFKQQCEGKS